MWEQVGCCSNADAQSIREAVAVLSKYKPRSEDVQPLLSKWHVAQNQHKKSRPRGHVLAEFETNVIEAAQQLQRQLASSTAEPASARSPTDRAQAHDDLSAGEGSFLAELQRRQRKRATQSEVDEQRSFAKPKATPRQNKRSARDGLAPSGAPGRQAGP